METIAETRRRAQETETSPWSRGVEKILADAPAGMSYRDLMARDERVDRYLTALLEDGAGCREHTWSRVYRHTAQRGVMSAKPCTDSCHVRGEPVCRRDKAAGDLFKHTERIDVSYPSGVSRLRLTGPDDWGYIELVEAVQKWERRRPVKRELPPAIGQYHVDDKGRYGLTLLMPDTATAGALGGLWGDDDGWSFEVGPTASDALEAAIDLKVEAEAGVFELVDSGDLAPGRAREVLEGEFGRQRTKFVGGFLTVTTSLFAGASGDTESDPDTETDYEEPNIETVSIEDNLLGRVRWAQKELAGHLIPDSWSEMVLRDVIVSADRLHLPKVRAAAERVLAEIPGDHFDCPIHPQCRLEETDMRMKTRHLAKAVEYRQVEWDDVNGMYTWSADDWPEWRSRTSRTESRTR